MLRGVSPLYSMSIGARLDAECVSGPRISYRRCRRSQRVRASRIECSTPSNSASAGALASALCLRDDSGLVATPDRAQAYDAQVGQLRQLLIVVSQAPTGLEREEILERCDISRPTFYRLVQLADAFNVRI